MRRSTRERAHPITSKWTRRRTIKAQNLNSSGNDGPAEKLQRQTKTAQALRGFHLTNRPIPVLCTIFEQRKFCNWYISHLSKPVENPVRGTGLSMRQGDLSALLYKLLNSHERSSPGLRDLEESATIPIADPETHALLRPQQAAIVRCLCFGEAITRLNSSSCGELRDQGADGGSSRRSAGGPRSRQHGRASGCAPAKNLSARANSSRLSMLLDVSLFDCIPATRRSLHGASTCRGEAKESLSVRRHDSHCAG